MLKLEKLPYDLTVCKAAEEKDLATDSRIYFSGKTDEEYSLVCETSAVPERTTARDDGWKAFRICGTLDFSLIGILSRISAILAEHKIGIFAVSTFNTDYILVKEGQFEEALFALKEAGYSIGDFKGLAP